MGSITYVRPPAAAGVMSCHSCADELNCALCGEGGCRTCPLGYYRCRQVVNGQAVTGCCPCQGAPLGLGLGLPRAARTAVLGILGSHAETECNKQSMLPPLPITHPLILVLVNAATLLPM